jgi:hypothetical protein
MQEPKGGSSLLRLLTVVLFVFFAFLMAMPLEAQFYSELDTVRTLEAGGFPGDTVSVAFDLFNTFAVGGFQFRVVYDTESFVPIEMNLSERSQQFELFGHFFGDPGAASFYATTMFPLDNAIEPGSGEIASLDFAIRDSATAGVYFLAFENTDSISHQNALSNGLGDSLVIPIFIANPISVLPVQSVSEVSMPGGFALGQNYPNPFNGATTICYFLESSGYVELVVVDILGRVISTPYSGKASAGENSITWDGKCSDGSEAVSGIYFYRLSSSGGNAVTKRMTLLK